MGMEDRGWNLSLLELVNSNGHNVTLWAPGFYLPELLDVENLVVKWLPLTLGDYLEMGSPSQDYSHDPESFIEDRPRGCGCGGTLP